MLSVGDTVKVKPGAVINTILTNDLGDDGSAFDCIFTVENLFNHNTLAVISLDSGSKYLAKCDDLTTLSIPIGQVKVGQKFQCGSNTYLRIDDPQCISGSNNRLLCVNLLNNTLDCFVWCHTNVYIIE